MLKKINKNTKKNTITYLMVILAWAIIELISRSGKLSNLISGMLVLLCVYSIMAVSLNLTVGILGELSMQDLCVSALSPAPSLPSVLWIRGWEKVSGFYWRFL